MCHRLGAASMRLVQEADSTCWSNLHEFDHLCLSWSSIFLPIHFQTGRFNSPPGTVTKSSRLDELNENSLTNWTCAGYLGPPWIKEERFLLLCQPTSNPVFQYAESTTNGSHYRSTPRAGSPIPYIQQLVVTTPLLSCGNSLGRGDMPRHGRGRR